MRLLLWSLSLSLSLWLLTACAASRSSLAPVEAADLDGGAGASAPRSEAEALAQVEALFAREAEASPMQPLTLGEKTVSLESSRPIEARRDEAHQATVLTLGLGSAAAVSCTLYDRPIDAGGAIFRALAAIKGRARIAPQRPTSIEVVEKFPAFFVDLAYLVEQEGTQKRGEVKLLVYASDFASLLCVHDEPGYAQTFHRVARGAAAALELARANPTPPAFHSIDLITLQGQQVGFARTTWLKRPGGALRVVTTSTTVMARTASDWLTSDEAAVAEVGKDGALVEKHFVSSSNGEPEQDLTLTRARRGVYQYRGTLQGKQLQGELTTADRKDLAGDPQQARRMKAEVVSGKKAGLRLDDYLPGATPVAFTPVVVHKRPGPNQVTIEAGPMRIEATLDASGLAESATLQLGPMTLVQQRAFVEGAP
jgi:hypothetical protein